MMKKITAFLVALLTMFCFTGCEFILYEESRLTNPRDTEDIYAAIDEGSPREEEALSGKLEIQIWTNESELSDKMWRLVIGKFEEVTGVSVTAHIGSTVNTQLSTRWQDGNPPDVVFLSGSGLPDSEWEKNGVIEEISDVIENGYVYGTDKKISDLVYKDVFERSGENAGYYRAGVSASAYGIFYDENYLKSFNLSVPNNYDELMKFVEDSVAAGAPSAFTTYGMVGSYTTWAMIMNALAFEGQELIDDLLLAKKSAWQSEEVRKILTRWREFSTIDGVLLTGTPSFDHTTAHMNWLNHKALLCGDGIWLPWEVKNNTPSTFAMGYRTSPLADAGKDPAVIAYPSTCAIASKAKNKKNAEAFVRFLYTKYVQQVLGSYEGYIPARNDLTAADMPEITEVSKKNLEYLLGGSVDLVWRRYNWGSLNEVVNGAVQQLMTGAVTVDEAVNRISAKTV